MSVRLPQPSVKVQARAPVPSVLSFPAFSGVSSSPPHCHRGLSRGRKLAGLHCGRQAGPGAGRCLLPMCFCGARSAEVRGGLQPALSFSVNCSVSPSPGRELGTLLQAAARSGKCCRWQEV